MGDLFNKYADQIRVRKSDVFTLMLFAFAGLLWLVHGWGDSSRIYAVGATVIYALADN